MRNFFGRLVGKKASSSTDAPQQNTTTRTSTTVPSLKPLQINTNSELNSGSKNLRTNEVEVDDSGYVSPGLLDVAAMSGLSSPVFSFGSRSTTAANFGGSSSPMSTKPPLPHRSVSAADANTASSSLMQNQTNTINNNNNSISGSSNVNPGAEEDEENEDDDAVDDFLQNVIAGKTDVLRKQLAQQKLEAAAAAAALAAQNTHSHSNSTLPGNSTAFNNNNSNTLEGHRGSMASRQGSNLASLTAGMHNNNNTNNNASAGPTPTASFSGEGRNANNTNNNNNGAAGSSGARANASSQQSQQHRHRYVSSAARSLQDYELIAFLGSGTFAEVTLARRKVTDDYFAVKKISKQRVKEEGCVERTFTERQLLANLQHPFLVRLYQAFQSQTHLYLVLDFAQGGDLYYLNMQQLWLRSMRRVLVKMQYPYYQSTSSTFNVLPPGSAGGVPRASSSPGTAASSATPPLPNTSYGHGAQPPSSPQPPQEAPQEEDAGETLSHPQHRHHHHHTGSVASSGHVHRHHTHSHDGSPHKHKGSKNNLSQTSGSSTALGSAAAAAAGASSNSADQEQKQEDDDVSEKPSQTSAASSTHASTSAFARPPLPPSSSEQTNGHDGAAGTESRACLSGTSTMPVLAAQGVVASEKNSGGAKSGLPTTGLPPASASASANTGSAFTTTRTMTDSMTQAGAGVSDRGALANLAEGPTAPPQLPTTLPSSAYNHHNHNSNNHLRGGRAMPDEDESELDLTDVNSSIVGPTNGSSLYNSASTGVRRRVPDYRYYTTDAVDEFSAAGASTTTPQQQQQQQQVRGIPPLGNESASMSGEAGNKNPSDELFFTAATAAGRGEDGGGVFASPASTGSTRDHSTHNVRGEAESTGAYSTTLGGHLNNNNSGGEDVSSASPHTTATPINAAAGTLQQHTAPTASTVMAGPPKLRYRLRRAGRSTGVSTGDSSSSDDDDDSSSPHHHNHHNHHRSSTGHSSSGGDGVDQSALGLAGREESMSSGGAGRRRSSQLANSSSNADPNHPHQHHHHLHNSNVPSTVLSATTPSRLPPSLANPSRRRNNNRGQASNLTGLNARAESTGPSLNNTLTTATLSGGNASAVEVSNNSFSSLVATPAEATTTAAGTPNTALLLLQSPPMPSSDGGAGAVAGGAGEESGAQRDGEAASAPQMNTRPASRVDYGENNNNSTHENNSVGSSRSGDGAKRIQTSPLQTAPAAASQRSRKASLDLAKLTQMTEHASSDDTAALFAAAASAAASRGDRAKATAEEKRSKKDKEKKKEKKKHLDATLTESAAGVTSLPSTARSDDAAGATGESAGISTGEHSSEKHDKKKKKSKKSKTSTPGAEGGANRNNNEGGTAAAGMVTENETDVDPSSILSAVAGQGGAAESKNDSSSAKRAKKSKKARTPLTTQGGSFLNASDNHPSQNNNNNNQSSVAPVYSGSGDGGKLPRSASAPDSGSAVSGTGIIGGGVHPASRTGAAGAASGPVLTPRGQPGLAIPLEASPAQEAAANAAAAHVDLSAPFHQVGMESSKTILHDLPKEKFAPDDTHRFPLRLIAFYAVEVALVLQYLHGEGFLYRDLKPENILMRGDGHVMLTDFGVAKYRKGAAIATAAGLNNNNNSNNSASGAAAKNTDDTTANPAGNPAAATTTADGKANSFTGTTQYMSPEMLRGLPHDSRTDWWSYGCLLFEWANGRKAFDGANQFSLFQAIVEEDVKVTPEDYRLTPLEVHTRVAQLHYRSEELRLAYEDRMARRHRASGLAPMTAAVVYNRDSHSFDVRLLTPPLSPGEDTAAHHNNNNNNNNNSNTDSPGEERRDNRFDNLSLASPPQHAASSPPVLTTATAATAAAATTGAPGRGAERSDKSPFSGLPPTPPTLTTTTAAANTSSPSASTTSPTMFPSSNLLSPSTQLPPTVQSVRNCSGNNNLNCAASPTAAAQRSQRRLSNRSFAGSGLNGGNSGGSSSFNNNNNNTYTTTNANTSSAGAVAALLNDSFASQHGLPLTPGGLLHSHNNNNNNNANFHADDAGPQLPHNAHLGDSFNNASFASIAHNSVFSLAGTPTNLSLRLTTTEDGNIAALVSSASPTALREQQRRERQRQSRRRRARLSCLAIDAATRDRYVDDAVQQMEEAQSLLKDLTLKLLDRTMESRLSGPAVLEHPFFTCPYVVSQLYYRVYQQRSLVRELKRSIASPTFGYPVTNRSMTTTAAARATASGGAGLGGAGLGSCPSFTDLTGSMAQDGLSPNTGNYLMNNLHNPTNVSFSTLAHGNSFTPASFGSTGRGGAGFDSQYGSFISLPSQCRPEDWRRLFLERRIRALYMPRLRTRDDLRYFPSAVTATGLSAAVEQHRRIKEVKEQQKEMLRASKATMLNSNSNNNTSMANGNNNNINNGSGNVNGILNNNHSASGNSSITGTLSAAHSQLGAALQGAGDSVVVVPMDAEAAHQMQQLLASSLHSTQSREHSRVASHDHPTTDLDDDHDDEHINNKTATESEDAHVRSITSTAIGNDSFVPGVDHIERTREVLLDASTSLAASRSHEESLAGSTSNAYNAAALHDGSFDHEAASITAPAATAAVSTAMEAADPLSAEPNTTAAAMSSSDAMTTTASAPDAHAHAHAHDMTTTITSTVPATVVVTGGSPGTVRVVADPTTMLSPHLVGDVNPSYRSSPTATSPVTPSAAVSAATTTAEDGEEGEEDQPSRGDVVRLVNTTNRGGRTNRNADVTAATLPTHEGPTAETRNRGEDAATTDASRQRSTLVAAGVDDDERVNLENDLAPRGAQTSGSPHTASDLQQHMSDLQNHNNNNNNNNNDSGILSSHNVTGGGVDPSTLTTMTNEGMSAAETFLGTGNTSQLESSFTKVHDGSCSSFNGSPTMLVAGTPCAAARTITTSTATAAAATPSAKTGGKAASSVESGTPGLDNATSSLTSASLLFDRAATLPQSFVDAALAAAAAAQKKQQQQQQQQHHAQALTSVNSTSSMQLLHGDQENSRSCLTAPSSPLSLRRTSGGHHPCGTTLDSRRTSADDNVALAGGASQSEKLASGAAAGSRLGSATLPSAGMKNAAMSVNNEDGDKMNTNAGSDLTTPSAFADANPNEAPMGTKQANTNDRSNAGDVDRLGNSPTTTLANASVSRSSRACASPELEDERHNEISAASDAAGGASTHEAGSPTGIGRMRSGVDNAGSEDANARELLEEDEEEELSVSGGGGGGYYEQDAMVEEPHGEEEDALLLNAQHGSHNPHHHSGVGGGGGEEEEGDMDDERTTTDNTSIARTDSVLQRTMNDPLLMSPDTSFEERRHDDTNPLSPGSYTSDMSPSPLNSRRGSAMPPSLQQHHHSQAHLSVGNADNKNNHNNSHMNNSSTDSSSNANGDADAEALFFASSSEHPDGHNVGGGGGGAGQLGHALPSVVPVSALPLHGLQTSAPAPAAAESKPAGVVGQGGRDQPTTTTTTTTSATDAVRRIASSAREGVPRDPANDTIAPNSAADGNAAASTTAATSVMLTQTFSSSMKSPLSTPSQQQQEHQEEEHTQGKQYFSPSQPFFLESAASGSSVSSVKPSGFDSSLTTPSAASAANRTISPTRPYTTTTVASPHDDASSASGGHDVSLMHPLSSTTASVLTAAVQSTLDPAPLPPQQQQQQRFLSSVTAFAAAPLPVSARTTSSTNTSNFTNNFNNNNYTTGTSFSTASSSPSTTPFATTIDTTTATTDFAQSDPRARDGGVAGNTINGGGHFTEEFITTTTPDATTDDAAHESSPSPDDVLAATCVNHNTDDDAASGVENEGRGCEGGHGMQRVNSASLCSSSNSNANVASNTTTGTTNDAEKYSSAAETVPSATCTAVSSPVTSGVVGEKSEAGAVAATDVASKSVTNAVKEEQMEEPHGTLVPHLEQQQQPQHREEKKLFPSAPAMSASTATALDAQAVNRMDGDDNTPAPLNTAAASSSPAQPDQNARQASVDDDKSHENASLAATAEVKNDRMSVTNHDEESEADEQGYETSGGDNGEQSSSSDDDDATTSTTTSNSSSSSSSSADTSSSGEEESDSDGVEEGEEDGSSSSSACTDSSSDASSSASAHAKQAELQPHLAADANTTKVTVLPQEHSTNGSASTNNKNKNNNNPVGQLVSNPPSTQPTPTPQLHVLYDHESELASSTSSSSLINSANSTISATTSSSSHSLSQLSTATSFENDDDAVNDDEGGAHTPQHALAGGYVSSRSPGHDRERSVSGGATAGRSTSQPGDASMNNNYHQHKGHQDHFYDYQNGVLYGQEEEGVHSPTGHGGAAAATSPAGRFPRRFGGLGGGSFTNNNNNAGIGSMSPGGSGNVSPGGNSNGSGSLGATSNGLLYTSAQNVNAPLFASEMVSPGLGGGPTWLTHDGLAETRYFGETMNPDLMSRPDFFGPLTTLSGVAYNLDEEVSGGSVVGTPLVDSDHSSPAMPPGTQTFVSKNPMHNTGTSANSTTANNNNNSNSSSGGGSGHGYAGASASAGSGLTNTSNSSSGVGGLPNTGRDAKSLWAQQQRKRINRELQQQQQQQQQQGQPPQPSPSSLASQQQQQQQQSMSGAAFPSGNRARQPPAGFGSLNRNAGFAGAVSNSHDEFFGFTFNDRGAGAMMQRGRQGSEDSFDPFHSNTDVNSSSSSNVNNNFGGGGGGGMTRYGRAGRGNDFTSTNTQAYPPAAPRYPPAPTAHTNPGNPGGAALSAHADAHGNINNNSRHGGGGVEERPDSANASENEDEDNPHHLRRQSSGSNLSNSGDGTHGMGDGNDLSNNNFGLGVGGSGMDHFQNFSFTSPQILQQYLASRNADGNGGSGDGRLPYGQRPRR